MKRARVHQLCLASAFVLTACASAPDETVGAGTGAASVATTARFATAHYGEVLDVVVVRGAQPGGTVSGRYKQQSFDDKGAPAASCQFTFAGQIEDSGGLEHAAIVAGDGFRSITGELTTSGSEDGKTLRGTEVRLHLDGTLNFCQAVAPTLADGMTLTANTKLAEKILDYRTVAVTKAFFYDEPSGSPREDFAVRGSAVVALGSETEGFVPVGSPGKEATVGGYLKVDDLAASTAPASPQAKAPGSGSFALDTGDGSTFTVRSSTDEIIDFVFDGADKATLVQGTALFGDGSALFGFSSKSGPCLVSFVFDDARTSVDVTQEGDCRRPDAADAPPRFDVTGHYAMK